MRSSSFAFLEEKGLTKEIKLSSAISDIRAKFGTSESPDSRNFESGKYASRPFTTYQKLMREGRKGQPDSHRFANHSPETKKKFRAIIDEKLSSQQVRERFNTKKSSTKLLRPDIPTPTLTTLPDDYVHYEEERILTVREYARIQSFPDTYEFKGKYTTGGKRRKVEVPRYTQVGNAIPPLFVEQAGLILDGMV